MNKEQNYWASISIDGIKQSMTQLPSKVKTSETYGKQLMVNVKMWDDGTASLSCWDAEKKERINVGKIMISTLDNQQAPKQELNPPAAENSPFDSPF